MRGMMANRLSGRTVPAAFGARTASKAAKLGRSIERQQPSRDVRNRAVQAPLLSPLPKFFHLLL